jgi:hypothetical protein
MAAHLLDVRKQIEAATKEAVETLEALQSKEAKFGKARVQKGAHTEIILECKDIRT